MGPPEQLPVPCARCGAPMRLEHSPSTNGEVVVACDYCGRREALPFDAAARVTRLRRRLAELEAAHRALDGVHLSLADTFERQNLYWLTGTLKAALGPLGLILVFVVGPALASGGSVVLPLALLVQLLLVVGGMVGGYTLMSRRYRRVVRPMLLARAPVVASGPARCRICGGDLPASGQAFVRCVYCRAPNLATEELARDRERLLRHEADQYRARARATVATAPFEHARFAAVGVVAGNVVGLGLGSAILWTAVFLALR